MPGAPPVRIPHPKYGRAQNGPSAEFGAPAGTEGNDITPKTGAQYAACCKRWYMMNVVILVSLITITVLEVFQSSMSML